MGYRNTNESPLEILGRSDFLQGSMSLTAAATYRDLHDSFVFMFFRVRVSATLANKSGWKAEMRVAVSLSRPNEAVSSRTETRTLPLLEAARIWRSLP